MKITKTWKAVLGVSLCVLIGFLGVNNQTGLAGWCIFVLFCLITIGK